MSNRQLPDGAQFLANLVPAVDRLALALEAAAAFNLIATERAAHADEIAKLKEKIIELERRPEVIDTGGHSPPVIVDSYEAAPDAGQTTPGT